jgi:excisionase family DNA binding protein
MIPGDELLTPQALAELLQIPVTSVRDLCRRRTQARDKFPLPYLRIGRRMRFNKREVYAWLGKLEGSRQ